MSQFGPEIPAPAIGLSLLPPGEYLPRKLLSQIYLICCQDLKSRVGELPASALYTLKTGIQLEIFSILFRYFRWLFPPLGREYPSDLRIESGVKASGTDVMSCYDGEYGHWDVEWLTDGLDMSDDWS